MKKLNKKEELKEVAQKQINRRNFVAFSIFAGFNALVYGGWRWLNNSSEETPGVTGGAKKLLRRALNKDELIFRNAFSDNHLVQTYPKSMAAKEVRVNSEIGIDKEDFEPAGWSLVVNKKNGTTLMLTLKDIMNLPKSEIIFDFKCVEGWDQISHWGGVKFTDFISHFIYKRKHR